MNSDKLNTALLHRASRYALAVGAVALGSLLRLGMDVWVGPGLPTYITFYPAVMLAALLGGFWPGILATVLVDGVVDLWILLPVGVGIASMRDAVGLGLFSFMGVFMSLVAELYRRARIKATAYDQEVALREVSRQKDFLADILQRANQPFAVEYPDGRLGLINSAFEQLTGYTADELKSIDWINGLTPPEWRDIEQEKLEALRRSGQPVRYEKDYIRKDGTRVPIELLVHLMNDAEGKPAYYYSFITDITERKRLELALQNKVQEQQTILDSVPAMVFYKDTDNRFIRTNRALEDAMGLSKNELEGKSIFDLYPQDQAEAYWRDDKEVMATGKAKTDIIEPMETPRGIRLVQTDKIPYVNEQGTVAGVIGFALDITERKEMEDALRKSRDELELRVQERTAMLQKVNELLREEIEDRRRIEIVVRESEARFRSLIHTAPVVIVSLAPDGTILEFNPEAELAYGRTRAEVLGRNYLDLFIPAEQYDMVTDAMKRVLAGEPISSYENPIRGADGSEQFYIWNIDRVIDDKGEPCAIIAVGHDVTERRKMLEALEAAAAYTRSIIEASLDPLVTINQDGKVTDLNRATEQIVNLPREQIIGNDFSDYFTEPEKARKVFQHVFKRGFVRDYPLAIKGRFGVVRDVLYNATVYRNRAGEIEGVFAAARDVTKRKRAEERLRESEERLKFLSSRLLEVQEHERKSIAADLHDSVASSLTAVILGLSRARPAIEVSDPKYRDIFTSSISMLQSAIDETRQLMNALRPPMLDDFGLISSIRWFTEQYRALYPQLTTDTEITIEENLIPAHLKIVLFRIIQEAFTNIAKHSRAQAASLYLKQKENTIDLVIADDGAGFDQEAVSSKQEPNRGLGIMSMQERTELSGGNLVIESARGQGTIISASWPLQP